jgi:hypothetical protein
VQLQDHSSVRALLLTILILGLVGTAVELLLLGHDEDITQIVPLALIAVSLTVIVWQALARSVWSLRLMRITMLALIAAGILGIILHYRGNVEFQKEVDPSIQGLSLFMKAMRSKTPPALAPAIMGHLGVLGLISTYLVSDRRKKYELPNNIHRDGYRSGNDV